MTILRDGFPETKVDLGDDSLSTEQIHAQARANYVYRSMSDPDIADVLINDVTRWLYSGKPLPAEYIEWIAFQLYARDPLVPNKPKNRPKSRETRGQQWRFACMYSEIRPTVSLDSLALQECSERMHKSYDTLKGWLYDPYVQHALFLLSKGKLGKRVERVE